MCAQIIGALADIITACVAFVTSIFVFTQVREMRRATNAGAFKAAYDILQTDDIRNARGHVLDVLKSKSFDTWSADDKKTAEKVCQSYDSVGILCKHGYLETEVICDSWGDSLRQTWATLAILVTTRRAERNSKEFWDDFEWLAERAEAYQRKLHSR